MKQRALSAEEFADYIVSLGKTASIARQKTFSAMAYFYINIFRLPTAKKQRKNFFASRFHQL
ncbi:MAG: hypothetical protein HKN14_00955 [Marinicaulis sp.]|nr:hypothetical protein [Marinicaulis sp.]